MSYLAAFVAGVLALLSIATGTGAAAVSAALVAGGFILIAVVLWLMDDHPRPPTGAHTA